MAKDKKKQPWLPDNFEGFTLYRIYYGDSLVYLGRTMQPLQDRIRGHLFKKPMQREISIDLVTKIECATFETQADMFLYEIYFINLWHPPLNRDDKAHDNLTIKLPDVEWKQFDTKLWNKWKKEIHEKDAKEETDRKRKAELILRKEELRKQRREGLITELQFFEEIEKLNMF